MSSGSGFKSLGVFGAKPGAPMDSVPVAKRRVRLKLAALAFSASRHGADAQGLSIRGLEFLALSAAEYVRELVGGTAPIDPRRLSTDERHIGELRLAALAYTETRHGADSTTKFAESGLAMLCQAAIEFMQGLPGWGRYAEDAVDPLLLEDGEGRSR